MNAKDFFDHLPFGRANAVTARQLAARYGISDRDARALADAAADAGLLVCADNHGYFRPATAAEVDETIGRLASQAARMSRRARIIRALADRAFGRQGTLL